MAKASDKPKSIKKQPTEIKKVEYVPAPNPKDIAAEKLKKMGLFAKNDGGVLMIYYKVTEKHTDVLKQVEVAINALGYDGSYGISPLKDLNS